MSNNSQVELGSKPEASFANAPTSKKIGFFSAMLVVIGSSVGAGIFFKAGSVVDSSHNSIVFAIFAWLLAAFAVISMAMALIEIASARNDNLSIIGWCQTFNSRFIYKSCKNFMVYIYLPLTYFFMPLYVVLSIQDGISALRPDIVGFNTKADWSILMVIAILMSVYFIVVNGLSAKAGNIQNWIITCVKFLPLLFAAVLGFVILGVNNGQVADEKYKAIFNPNVNLTEIANNENPDVNFAKILNLNALSPGFGLFIAMGAIFFAFDGFYVTAGIQTEMKEPKKTPWAILFGMIFVTVIYLVIAISMSLGAEGGKPSGFQSFLVKHDLNWLYALFQILIGVGVLGIINGFALWSTRFMEDLIRANEVPFSTKLVNKINDKRAVVGIKYNLALAIPVIIIFCIIGGLAYVDAGDYGPSYGTGSAELYSFADLMATWTAVIAFAYILFAIIGAISNRKTKKIKVQKSKFFLPMAYSSIISMILPIFFTFFAPIADFFLMFLIPTSSENWAIEVLIPRLMVVIVLIIFLAFMFVPIWVEDYFMKKKFGSIEKGEIDKIHRMAIVTNKTLKQALLEQIRNEKRTILNEEEKLILGVEKIQEANWVFIPFKY
ncbi:APC family permease [Mycoplasma sp. E35C]|uniref:APC family permease n=1 Tax=Mycoplasma sp. E35C TaxID=2801918 RepID=UPI002104F812|nr:APC family permease [Mycoplasma sp. E35C]